MTLAKDTDEGTLFAGIGFTVGDEQYGLALDDVQEIITAPRITRVPKSPTYIKGVINLHGNVIPVLDIAARFGTGTTTLSAGSKIVVVEGEDEVVGLLAEAVGKVTRFREEEVQPPPPLVAGISAEYLDGVVRVDGQFLIFLNLAKTLDENDDGANTSV
jgi:purine-binding chemotaxis protein CheW